MKMFQSASSVLFVTLFCCLTPAAAVAEVIIKEAVGLGVIPHGEYAGQPFRASMRGEYAGEDFRMLRGELAVVIGSGSSVQTFRSIEDCREGFQSFCSGEGFLNVEAGFFSLKGLVEHDGHQHLASAWSEGDGAFVCININDQTGTITAPTDPALAHDPEIGIVCSRQVRIDLKPDDPENRINPRAAGLVKVAVLAALGFDPGQVDPLSVRFGVTGSEAPARRTPPAEFTDVNGDGLDDLVLAFRLPATGIGCDSGAVFLSGLLVDGSSIFGSDVVRTVGCPR